MRVENPDRVTLRRHDAFPVVIVLLVTTGTALALWVRWPPDRQMVAGIAAMLVMTWSMSYLDGPAAYVTVTTKEVIIGNTFTVRHVPRALITSIGGYENQGVTIGLVNGDTLRIGAFDPGMNRFTSRSYRGYARRGHQLDVAMERISAARNTAGAVISGIRYENMVIALASLAFVAYAIWWGFH